SVTLILHNFSPKAFGFQVFTTDKKTDPHLRNVGHKIGRRLKPRLYSQNPDGARVEEQTVKITFGG
ncbi:MAG: hypothetical protein EAZ73_22655, partial [Oscillatoriales cyanobacterium]|uniref:hypothetical protein n=1 Tax=unclassified Microcoleus TaxID=2642155 RepID=UPI0025F73F33